MTDRDARLLLAEFEATAGEGRSPLGALRRFARARPAAEPAGKCELCASPLAAEHHHMVDLRTRRLVCCCEPCGLLFSSGQSASYRRVPTEVRSLGGFRLSDAQWESLMIPINLAFFYRPEDKRGGLGESGLGERGRREPAGRHGQVIAVYPSPGGPVESLLDLEAWQAIVDDNPDLGDMQAEVEALLVNRLWGKSLCYLVPIDACYRLSGLIRRHWRGLSGGSEVWEEVERYFDRLKEKACST